MLLVAPLVPLFVTRRSPICERCNTSCDLPFVSGVKPLATGAENPLLAATCSCYPSHPPTCRLLPARRAPAASWGAAIPPRRCGHPGRDPRENDYMHNPALIIIKSIAHQPHSKTTLMSASFVNSRAAIVLVSPRLLNSTLGQERRWLKHWHLFICFSASCGPGHLRP